MAGEAGNRLPWHMTVSETARMRNGLEMRVRCESCDAGLKPADTAFICSYECTFCSACARSLDETCPNCGGELVPRPRRSDATVDCEVEPA